LGKGGKTRPLEPVLKDPIQLHHTQQPNELRVDAAGRAKVETAEECAAASNRVGLSRTQGYQRPAVWDLNVTQAHWVTACTDHIDD